MNEFVLTPDLWLICTIFAGFFGACVGSFLNVCIYRIPLDLSVVKPRSHCMQCQKLIPWYWNIPVLSYFMLRGRCHNCQTPFSFRYAFVELLTAFLFILVCVAWPPQNMQPMFGMVALQSAAAVPVAWLFLSGLIIGTFVDFDHFIIPDSVTIGGTVAGLVISIFVPEMHGQTTWSAGLLWSAIGAAAGFSLLYAIAILGKLAFGRKRVALEEPGRLSFVFKPDDAAAEPELHLDDESMPWEELFYRVTDRWIFDCTSVTVGTVTHQNCQIVLSPQGLTVADQTIEPSQLTEVSAEVEGYIFPREAMGFGDVKLMAAVGAFLGWQATLFTLIAAAFVGTIVGLALIISRRREFGARLPFGPYLALGATIWLFWGPRIVDLYVNLLRPAAIQIRL